ncbi:MAG: lysophospholipid acyltransferase family protein [Chitinophagaceae bacterium]
MKAIFGRIWATWGLIWFVVTMLLFMIPFIIISRRKEPKRTINFIAASRIWMGIYMPLIGCPVTIRGKENFIKGQNYIVLCNHNAFIDVPVSSPGIPGGNKTIAKAELAKTPVFGMLYKMGSVLVDRKSEASRRESFTSMKNILNMGLHMCIYPEGTRNRTDEPLKSFHDGAFRLAIATRKSLLPALIFNSRKVMPEKPVFSLFPHRMKMHFLPAIAIKEDDTVESLKARLFQIMSDYYVANDK